MIVIVIILTIIIIIMIAIISIVIADSLISVVATFYTFGRFYYLLFFWPLEPTHSIILSFQFFTKGSL